MKKQKAACDSGSRMAAKKLERAQKILEAAFKCFHKYGFKNTTMAMIAEKADMSVGSLYNYHRTKEELLLNGILLSRDGFAKDIEDLVSQDLKQEEHWLKLTEIYLSSFSRYGKRVWREFFAAVFSESPERAADIQEIDTPFIAGILKILKDDQKGITGDTEENLSKVALVIYRLWQQEIIQFILSESATVNEMQSGFLEDLKTLGLIG
jgi:AcrR family transcriptional regulator